MSETKTSEEVKSNMISIMGTKFGSLFYQIYNEICWLNFKWIEFEELYGKKESRIEIMNESAPFFFYVTQKVLWENLLLGIARITDPPKSKGKLNTTLKAISEFIDDKELKKEFDEELKDIEDKAKFCRDWRNRWIAHMDYELTVNQSAEPLETATRNKLKAINKKIQIIYNKISKKYLGSTVAFELANSQKGAISLLYKVEDGIKFEKDRYKRKLRGEWNEEDSDSRV
jgi:hypothetical protein